MPTLAAACPLIDQLIDVTCDQKLRIAGIGDSIMWGRIDRGRRDRYYGYLGRFTQQLEHAQISNLGIPGAESSTMYSRLMRGAQDRPTVRDLSRLRGADYILIDIGRNDFWKRPRVTPGYTVKMIERTVVLLKRELTKDNGIVPIITVADLLPTTRKTAQALYIAEVNRLLTRYRSSRLPVFLSHQTLDPLLISSDGIHPTPLGYQTLATGGVEYLRTRAQTSAARRATDADGDGVSDFFEVQKFLTDPTLADTDGDGYSDGEELFILHTDPLVAQL